MGSDTVMRDDNYTFNVIQHTIKALVPPLCEHGPELIQQMVQLFVDSFYNIPTHRRMLFYAILVGSITVERLFLILDALLHSEQPDTEEDEDTKAHFALELAVQFVPISVVNNFVQMLSDATKRAAGQLDHSYVLKLFTLICEFLTSKVVIGKILKFTLELDKRMH